jgi:hypothetical protein
MDLLVVNAIGSAAMPASKSVCAGVTALSMVIITRAALAQEATAEAARRELISQATHASDHDDHPRAVELLTRAGQVRMSTSLRAFLAEELAETGAWLRAFSQAVECQREANADERLHHRREILRDCARLEARARPHLGQVVIEAPAEPPSLRVRVAGVEVPRAFWGVQFPVASGVNLVEATADDGRVFRTEVTIPEGGRRAVSVTLPAVVVVAAVPTPIAQPVPTAPSEPSRVVASVVPSRDLHVDAPPRSNALRTGAWTAIAFGAVGVAAGVAATVLASGAATRFNERADCGEAETNRGASGCEELFSEVSTMQRIAITGWIVGGLGVATGAVLLAIPSGASRRGARASRGWSIASGPGDVGASLVARY